MKKKLSLTLILIILIVVIFKVFNIYSMILKRFYPDTYSEYVSEYSKKYNIEQEWIYALIKAESNFKAESVSRKWCNRTYATYGKNSRRSIKRCWHRRN